MTKLEILEVWQGQMQAVDAQLDKLIDTLDVNPESPLLTAVWALQASYSSEVEAHIAGSRRLHAEWLDWYANENAYGANGLEAGITGDMRHITSLEDLLWAIEVKEANNDQGEELY
jgi:hypothetical protein